MGVLAVSERRVLQADRPDSARVLGQGRPGGSNKAAKHGWNRMNVRVRDRR